MERDKHREGLENMEIAKINDEHPNPAHQIMLKIQLEEEMIYTK